MRVTFVGEVTALPDHPQTSIPAHGSTQATKPEMRSMTTMVRRDLHRAVSIMAIDEDTTLQALIEEAMTALLASRRPGQS